MQPGHPGELAPMLGAAADLRKRFKDLDVEHDIPDGVGCNTQGTIRYIDKDLFNAVVDGQADTGLTPEQVIDCLVEHIEAEKTLKDHDNGVDHWADLSLLAHQAEAEKVKSFGGDVDRYDRALAPLFIACKQKEAKNVPDDLMDLGEQDDGEASGIQESGGVDQQARGRVEGAGGSDPGQRDAEGEPSSEASEQPPQTGEVDGEARQS